MRKKIALAILALGITGWIIGPGGGSPTPVTPTTSTITQTI